VIWRTQSNEVWINFKVFGLLALTFGFAISQGPFMAKHMIEDKPEAH
jgi:intracellular septation protein